MRKLYLLLSILLVAPLGFASNLTVAPGVINGTAAFINARQNMTVFFITVEARNASVNISGINVTITGANVGNISRVSVFENATNTTGGALLGTNASLFPNLTAGSQIFVNFTSSGTPLVLANNSRSAIFLLFEIHTNATVNATIAGELRGPGDILANVTVFANASLPNSTLATIRNLRANATLSPNFADTSVVNQSFIYTVTPTGNNSIKSLLIQLPSSLVFINITAVTIDGSNTTSASKVVDGRLINITPDLNTSQGITVYFTANTSSSDLASAAVSSFISGGDIANFTTDTAGSINLTVRQMVNVTNVTIAKNTAILNGTDFWEFNFTMTFRGNVSAGGLLQFKLSNWTDSQNRNISITSATGSSAVCPVTHCATLRNETNFNTTGKYNVTNDYTMTNGLNLSSVNSDSSATTFILRMALPASSPVSSSWSATYGFLLRSIP